MELIKSELQAASEMFKEEIVESGWHNSSTGMQKIWLKGANFGSNIVERNIFQLNIQKLRATQSDAEFRKMLHSMLGF